MDEMLYHVDDNDSVLGQIDRSKAHKKAFLHRTGIVFLMNSEDRILICKRNSNKKTFPSCYDSSVSFHVTYGETYEESAKRETKEEIRIEAHLQPIGKFIHQDPPEYQIVAVFLCISDANPVIDRTEFSEEFLLFVDEVERLVQKERVTPWLKYGWSARVASSLWNHHNTNIME